MEPAGEKGKQAVPKFSSFKPKLPLQAVATEHHQEKHRDDKGARERDAAQGSQKSRHGRRHAHPKESKDSDKLAPPEHPRVPERSIEYRERSQLASDIFKIDRKGDRYNVEYGAPHKYDIPLYRRLGAGRVLGLRSNYVIDHESSMGNKIVIHMSGSGRTDIDRQRFNTSAWRQASKYKDFRRVRPSVPAQAGAELQQNFIPLSSSGSRKRRKVENSLYYDVDFPDYRSLEGKAKPPQESAFDMDLTSDSDLESEGQAARQQNSKLSVHVSAHPEDVSGWLDLIDHQENLVGVADSEGRRTFTSAERRSIADVKISIYEKALTKVSSSAPRDRLILGMMEEGAQVWDTKTLSNNWKNILQSNAGYISLWVKYLDFQQTRFTSFTYENCRSILLECLHIIRTSRDNDKRDIIHIYILLRLSLFMREAGYQEHAVAMWQAILEFNFCRPPDLSTTYDAISSFSDFWDGEGARLGEANARGWDAAGHEPPTAKAAPPPGTVDTAAIFDSWIKVEQNLMHHSCLPARTQDEAQEDDPYQVILSSDISEFLAIFSEDVSDLLLDAFLLFCRLPPQSSGKNPDTLSQWCEDPFIRNLILDQSDIPAQWLESISSGPENHESATPILLPYSNFANNEDTMFSDASSWYSAFLSWKNTYADNAGIIDARWARQTLRHLVGRTPTNDALAKYSIGLEYACNPDNATKYAKSLLRKRPLSVELYNTYALVESRRGQDAAAEKVWMTTLSMNNSFSEDAKRDFVLLWRSWLWELLTKQDIHKAIQLLRAMPDTSIDAEQLSEKAQQAADLSPAELLKIRRILVDSRDHGLSFRKPLEFVSSTDCLAVLAYLKQGRDIDSALQTYRDAEERLAANNLAQAHMSELLHQSKARLLWHHTSSTRRYKLALIREELSRSLALFPHNTIFLSLFAYNESRFRTDDRVRDVLRHHIAPPHQASGKATAQPPLTPHFFSIYSELHRGVSTGSTAHSARAAFETAVGSSGGQCSAALWKLYILFELALGHRRRARDVFYRAIRSCPWAKALVLLAFEEPGLREEMGFGELRKVWNVLVEKGLRVHVDLEDVLDEMDDERREAGRAPIVLPDDRSSNDEM
ncbi:hypothetical protein LOZ45_000310 [Ophidiomyces ophidiicola]|nr:hypothetical protein LOZ45_000310 [Ophidiomyces ophidiicola]